MPLLSSGPARGFDHTLHRFAGTHDNQELSIDTSYNGPADGPDDAEGLDSAFGAPAEPEARRRTRAGRRKPRNTKRRRTIAIVLSSVGIVILALAAATGWVVYQALQAKSSLETAQSSVSDIQSDLTKLDVSALPASVATFQNAAHDAADHTNDPLFKLAEKVPVVGPNLTAVRQLSEALDQIGSQALPPVMTVASSVTPDALKPVDGRLNVDLLSQGDAALATADTALQSAQATVDAVDTSGTVDQIVSAKRQFSTALTKAHDQIGTVRTTVATVQGILGVNGPRHYILAFLNNAETTGLGGGPASLSMLTVDNGSFAITDQASSTDFPLTDGPVRDIDPNLLNIYSDGFASTLNWSTSRPDFPTAAQTIEAFWQKYKGGTVDGVISIDPIALSYLLQATGPITVPSTGDVIDSQNAVSLLLHDIYLRYPASEIQSNTDAFFADAAKSIFTGITNTTADPTALLDAMTKSISSGNLMAWSPVDAEEKMVTTAGLDGVLPTSNKASTVVGAYFRDVTVSKTDYWLQTSSTLDTDVCTNSQNPTFTTTVTLHSTITDEEAATLPNFVVGGNFKGRKFSTEVYIYGPVGGTLASSAVGDTSVDASVRSGATDLDRPVARYLVDLAPGETNTVTATFSGAPGDYGAPVLTGTPMINATTTQVTAPGCK
ncbi:DUF4012 domain-containing protein [Subtercola sp. YIM 133946]|uniref:DUF4012 domain-containing protein n=1 Tax=Subtercola sp. YIM 133946 TaxID=3118909 RepID=UPI002F946ACF